VKLEDETSEDRIERIGRRLSNDNSGRTMKVWRGVHKHPEEIKSEEDYLESERVRKAVFFEKCLRLGKSAENKIKELLILRGFTIIDISEEIEPDDRVSPFDMIILPVSGDGYIADIKNKTPSAGDFILSAGWRRSIERWRAYDTARRIPSIAPLVHVHLRKIVIFYSDRPWMQEYTKHLPYIANFIDTERIVSKRVPYKETTVIDCL